jgi:DNA-binding response OmpR family regulator
MKILLMDDEYDIALTLGMFLESSGFEVKTASNGQEGVDIYCKELSAGVPFDLVITDHRMPIKDGTQVIKEILEVVPSQRIFLMTAYHPDCDFIRALPKDKITIIPKPFDLEQFVMMIQKPSTSRILIKK